MNHTTKPRERDTVEVLCFDFSNQIVDIVWEMEPSKKWEPYKNVGDNPFEVFGVSCYQYYAKQMICDSAKEFCCPLEFYISANDTVTHLLSLWLKFCNS